jgi:hypothetical protein
MEQRFDDLTRIRSRIGRQLAEIAPYLASTTGRQAEELSRRHLYSTYRLIFIREGLATSKFNSISGERN